MRSEGVTSKINNLERFAMNRTWRSLLDGVTDMLTIFRICE
jgi:hypothetical protein